MVAAHHLFTFPDAYAEIPCLFKVSHMALIQHLAQVYPFQIGRMFSMKKSFIRLYFSERLSIFNLIKLNDH